jgi:hypothetical protein
VAASASTQLRVATLQREAESQLARAVQDAEARVSLVWHTPCQVAATHTLFLYCNPSALYPCSNSTPLLSRGITSECFMHCTGVISCIAPDLLN